MLRLISFLRGKISVNPETKLSELGNHLLLSIGFVVFCFVLDIVLVVLLSKAITGNVTVNINNVDNLFDALVSFCLPSALCFSVLPIFVNIKCCKRNHKEFGLGFIWTKRSRIIKIVSMCIFGGCCFMLFGRFEVRQAWLIFFVFIFVGINEEILVRGVLFDILRLKFRPFVAAIVASLIFAFVLHSGGGFYANMFFRFPLSMLLFGVYLISGDIYSSMLLHMSYNILVNCL